MCYLLFVVYVLWPCMNECSFTRSPSPSAAPANVSFVPCECVCVCVRSKKNNFTIKHVLQSTNKREKFARVHLKVIKTDRQPASQPLSHAWIGSGAAYNYYNH